VKYQAHSNDFREALEGEEYREEDLGVLGDLVAQGHCALALPCVVDHTQKQRINHNTNEDEPVKKLVLDDTNEKQAERVVQIEVTKGLLAVLQPQLLVVVQDFLLLPPPRLHHRVQFFVIFAIQCILFELNELQLILIVHVLSGADAILVFESAAHSARQASVDVRQEQE